MAKATTKKRKDNVKSTGETHISKKKKKKNIGRTNKKAKVISWSSAGNMG